MYSSECSESVAGCVGKVSVVTSVSGIVDSGGVVWEITGWSGMVDSEWSAVLLHPADRHRINISRIRNCFAGIVTISPHYFSVKTVYKKQNTMSRLLDKKNEAGT